MNEKIMRQMGFGAAADAFSRGECPFCGTMVDVDKDFRDEVSRREFKISGLCQACQDETFIVSRGD